MTVNLVYGETFFFKNCEIINFRGGQFSSIVYFLKVQ